MSGRKRKADDESPSRDSDERMSTSPSNSPSAGARSLPHPVVHPVKRLRTNLTGRSLSLPRLLETLDADSMRSLLQTICDRHPTIGAEVVATAPRPSVPAALAVLAQYSRSLQAALPFGNRPSSDYAYNRVRHALAALLDALRDYTPHFLPPHEAQASVSLEYLHGATDIVHSLPHWDNAQHNRYKTDAYEEIGRAWALVIREAAKRGGGIQLQYGGWDRKLMEHNEQSGRKMEEAVQELRSSLGWLGSQNGEISAGGFAGHAEALSVREQLLAGTYGSQLPVHVGPW
ncbi:MAG: Tethering factor for nuclear proteasome sts1 [Bathelium mastoideum]|nr:MAG: Tethering factor for nuclear proteasome sts1 [Bathelium mastoideum]